MFITLVRSLVLQPCLVVQIDLVLFVTEMERCNGVTVCDQALCKTRGSAKETFKEMIKVFGDEVMSRAQVWWHKEFKTKDKASPGNEQVV